MSQEIARDVTFANIANMTVIRDHADIQSVLRSPDVVQLKGDLPLEGRPFTTGSLLAINGDQHLARRRLYATLFSNEMLHYLYDHGSRPVIVDTLVRLAEDSAKAGTEPEADLAEMGAMLLYRVAAQIVGVDGVETDEGVNAFTRIVDGIGKGIALEWIHDPDPIVVEAQAAQEELRERFFNPSLARRRELVQAYREGRIERADLTRDVITLWLLDTDSDVDEEMLLIEVGVFLNASTRTTVRVLPHIVQRIATWLDEHPEDRQHATESTFLRGAISESLRLHGLIPALLRRVVNPITLPSGATLEPGEQLALIFRDASVDPEIYGDDTMEFDPYRINRLPRKTSPWGLAFGGGAHMCIGRRLVTGGDWRRDSEASDRDVDGSLVAIVRALFEAGVRPHPDKAAVDHVSAHFSEYDEYLTYPVTFTTLDRFVASARASTKEA
ncbi:cytochrome P450 [Amycolatopsis sp. K13G38]|uniref:Cytochrome P450 n=1 Tax=Amycolatopsis acididurans TaxID=2724524 RepID=A0ABX1J8R2_9PSEU|nr:cytochrome P450 [Amycolatopsis acididurans]NKQ56181.1 cytochrome P450 [Amycolatopsis acididurans]